MVRLLLILLSGYLVMVAIASAAYWRDDPAIERRIDALLGEMTLAEKLGQMNQYSAGTPSGPSKGGRSFEAAIRSGDVGSFLNVAGEDVNRYQHLAVEQSRLKIPLLFGFDVIHGYRTVFPIPLGLAAAWDPGLVERSAAVAAAEARADGVRWTFAPMVDIARDARWGRIAEGAGEDPFLGAALAAAYVRGFQGPSLEAETSLLACLKHFVGYGAAEGGRDYNTTEIPERLLRQVYLPPFRAGLEAGAATVMSAFNALNGVPASANPFTLGQILHKEWRFKGFVVSDWTSILETVAHGTAVDGADAAVRSVLAGVDMDMESDLYRTTLAAAVAEGKVPIGAVDAAVRRILRVKFAAGLFEQPYAVLDPGRMVQPASRDLAREAAEKSFVLLKNDGVLPLKPDAEVALIGPLADSAADMLGSWSGKGKDSDAVTLEAALSARLGPRLRRAKGTDIRGASDAGFAEALAIARQSDVVVLALGEDAAKMTGEAASRSELDLPGNQEALLEAVAATGKPMVLVLFSGRPLVLDHASALTGAILAAWFPGVEAGPALVETLFGDSNPSGRLTASFPRAVGQEPLYYDQLSTGRPWPDQPDATLTGGAAKYKSRYIDQLNTPLYLFGYGLSYTSFAYGPVRVERLSYAAADLAAGTARIKVTAKVSNTGARAGTAVVQLYINQRGTSVARPVRELKGFRRVDLQAGAEAEVEFQLGRDELSFWNIDMKNVVEPGLLKIWIADDSRSGTPAEVTLQ